VDIRPAPSTSGIRNGMPESGGYVYRGWYIDIMPNAITDDCTTGYDTGLSEPKPDEPIAAAKGRCGRCNRTHRPIDAV
jgi:hypothetical protein